MTRPLRRRDRELPGAEGWSILREETEGFLATADGQGQPYVVAVNYVLLENTIYIHSALEGHKVDNLRANPRACFSVMADVRPGHYTTYYRSVVAFCRARLLEEGDEWRRALEALCEKYMPGGPGYSLPYRGTLVIALDIQHLSGKGNQPPR
ncbi:MAG: pyridoxamine 5'-phosphate oxidase family protein [Bacillota bacterium]